MGVAVAARELVGGDGCVRASEREEAEERRATGRVIERSRGFGISVASSRRIGEGPGRQGGRRWPARGGHAPPSFWRGRKTTGRESGDGLGRSSWAGWAAR